MVLREPSNNFTSEITLMLTHYYACVNSLACDYCIMVEQVVSVSIRIKHSKMENYGFILLF